MIYFVTDVYKVSRHSYLSHSLSFQIAHYKVPRYIIFKDEFPTTVTGKVQKFKMREMTIKELNLKE